MHTINQNTFRSAFVSQVFKAIKCQADDWALTNCAVVNDEDFRSDTKYVKDNSSKLLFKHTKIKIHLDT